MLFVAPIPRQEILNARIISHQGAGVICFNRGGIAAALRYLNGDQNRIRAMRRKCGEFAKPTAAREICAHLWDTSRGAVLYESK
jgi:UDP-N-acetylglucosamine:LPS N-acetylglucosamine transferase